MKPKDVLNHIADTTPMWDRKWLSSLKGTDGDTLARLVYRMVTDNWEKKHSDIENLEYLDQCLEQAINDLSKVHCAVIDLQAEVTE
jgi:hypothetical protein